MYSIAILSTFLFALVASTNASQCRPVTCMIHCPYGFDVNSQGCPICQCLQTPNVCIEPISSYNCGVLGHQACPSTHECQFGLSGLSGRCCLKHTGSTNQLGVTGSTSTRVTPTTTKTHPTTTRPRTTTTAKTHPTTTRPRTTTTPKTRPSTTTRPRTTTRRALSSGLKLEK